MLVAAVICSVAMEQWAVVVLRRRPNPVSDQRPHRVNPWDATAQRSASRRLQRRASAAQLKIDDEEDPIVATRLRDMESSRMRCVGLLIGGIWRKQQRIDVANGGDWMDQIGPLRCLVPPRPGLTTYGHLTSWRQGSFLGTC